MSDEWIFYPCQMGEHIASIFYDHGIRETLDHVAPPHLLKVQISLKRPGSDGLSSSEEYQPLCALEDELQTLAERHHSLYVGRITVGGRRHLHIFTGDSEADWSSRLQSIGARHGYELAFVLTPDPARDGYWRDLFPSDDDWQLIQDMRVLESLRNEGDDGTASRRIDHWAYFHSQAAAERFSQWARERGYSVDTAVTPDDREFGVRFAHEGTVRLPDITSHTIALRRKASELGGDYDGWETEVCKPSG